MRKMNTVFLLKLPETTIKSSTIKDEIRITLWLLWFGGGVRASSRHAGLPSGGVCRHFLRIQRQCPRHHDG